MEHEPGTTRAAEKPRPGGPIGRLGTILGVLGLFIVVLADQPLGAILCVIGLVLCLFDLVIPGRDLRGRRF
jgi:drug/metabolite transporter (DMT)-like permease